MTDTRRASNPEQTMRFLGDRLRGTLALLHQADDDLISLALGTLPRGSRILLTTLGAVETAPRDSSKLVLTPFGQELSACCAVAGFSPDLRKKKRALEQERARRAALCGNDMSPRWQAGKAADESG